MIEYPLALFYKGTGKQGISLDIGCGTSPFSSFIAKHFDERLVSIDINRKSLFENYKTTKDMKINNVSFIYCDAQKLPFKEESFSNIYSISTFEHIPNDRKAVKEMFNVLNKYGIAVIVIPFTKKSRDPVYVKGMWQRFYTLKDIVYLFGRGHIKYLVYSYSRNMFIIASKLKMGWLWIKDFFIAAFFLLIDSHVVSLWKPKSEMASILIVIEKK